MTGITRWIGSAALCSALLLSTNALAADTTSLQSALDHLQAARNDLERDSNAKNKDLRKEAMGHVNQAIDSVRKIIQKEGKKK